jgi:hypothetical protein
MKRIITLFLLLTTTLFYSQSSGITYQAVLYNPSVEILPGNNNANAVLANKNICLRFSITDEQTSLVYQETQRVTTDEFGMVNLVIGSGNQIGGYAASFTTIVWNSTTKKLQVAIDATGTCSNFVEISNQDFSAVPFAYASKTAESVSGVVPIVNGGTGSSTVSGAKTNLGLNHVDNTSDVNKPISNATQTALNLKENTINKSTNTALGTSDVLFPTQNAVKTYVDNQLSSGVVDATSAIKGKIQLAGDLGGTATNPTVPGLALKEPTIVSGTISQYYRGDKTWKTLDKTAVGLGNVDNTSDANKPISNATQTALTLKENAINKSTNTALGTSDDLYPTQNAVKTYIDNALSTSNSNARATDLDMAGNSISNALAIRAGNFQMVDEALHPFFGGTDDNAITILNRANNVTQFLDGRTGSPILAITNSINSTDTFGTPTAEEGKIGIGTTAPSEKLEVVGNIKSQSFIKENGTASQFLKADGSTDSTEYAALSSPVFTGIPSLPTGTMAVTQAAGNNTTALATTAFVQSAVAASTIADATDTVKGKLRLRGDLGGTADAPTVPGLANKENTIAAGTTTQYYRGDKTWQTLDKAAVGLGNVDNTADVDKVISTATQTALTGKEDKSNKSTATSLGTSDDLYPTQNAVKTYVDNQVSAGVIDATDMVKGKIQLAGDLAGTGSTAATPVISNNAITTTKIANAAVTNAKIGETITVANGGTGATSLTGYLKGNGTSAFTSVSTIPVTDVTGAVRKVNGVQPDTNGNVAVMIGRVFTGATIDPNLATSIINASPAKQQSDIYIVADGSNPNNGRTFIYDGANWLEVATDLSTTDARYVNVAGDTMEGDLTVPTTKKITIVDAPANATDAANRGYVDTKIGGTGTANFVPKFSAAKTLLDSSIFDNGNVGIGTTTPANKLEITQGTAGNSGLRFTNLNSSSSASASASKVLGLNSSGDVILTNIPGTQNIVSFSTVNPNSGSPVFTPNTQTDPTVIYQSAIDNSLWTYNGTTYVTYTSPATTEWNLANTTNDAGSNKTSSIWRSGGLGIGINNPTSLFEVYSSGSNLATISTIGTGTTNAGINFITLKDNSSIGASTNRGWQIAARSNAWNSGGTNEANALTMSYWNGSVWQQALKAGVNGNIALGSVVYNSMPQYNLDVYGTLRSTNSSYLATNSGNVGIGTLTPVGSLMLYGNSQALSGYSKEIVFGRGGATKGLAAIAATDSGNFGGGLAFITKPSNSIDDFPVNVLQAMTIDPSGKVGIGTISPSAQLEVATTNGSAAIFRRGNTSGGASNIYLQRTQNTDPNINTAGSYATDVIGKVIFSMANGTNYPANGNTSIESYYMGAQTSTNSGGGLTFKTTSSGTNTSIERMRIDHNGNIGIGIATPSAQLHTTGSVRFAGAGTPAAGKVLTSDASGNATWQNTPGATINIQTGNYTLTENDSKGVVIINSNSNVTVTVPGTLPTGFFCQIIQKGAGTVTVSGASGVTIQSANGLTTRAQFSSIGLLMESSTTGYISGDSGL